MLPVTTGSALAGAFDEANYDFKYQAHPVDEKDIRPGSSASSHGMPKKLLKAPEKLSVFQMQWETAAPPAPPEQQRWYFLATNAAWMIGVRYVDTAKDIDVVLIFDEPQAAGPGDSIAMAAARQSFKDAGVPDDNMPDFVPVAGFGLNYASLYSDFSLEVSRAALNAHVEGCFAKVGAVARATKVLGLPMVEGMQAFGGSGSAGDKDVRHALAAASLWYLEPLKLTCVFDLCAKHMREPGSKAPVIKGT